MNTRRIEELSARLLAGPTPTSHGYVVFQVAVAAQPPQVVEVLVTPGGGVGCSRLLDLDVDLDVLNPAMVLVADHIRAIQVELSIAVRDAARLRKAAGNRPLYGNHRHHSPPPAVELRHETQDGYLLFDVDVAGIVVPVFAGPDGGLFDLPEEVTVSIRTPWKKLA
jgi:hypothetical protein